MTENKVNVSRMKVALVQAANIIKRAYKLEGGSCGGCGSSCKAPSAKVMNYTGYDPERIVNALNGAIAYLNLKDGDAVDILDEISSNDITYYPNFSRPLNGAIALVSQAKLGAFSVPGNLLNFLNTTADIFAQRSIPLGR